MAGNILLSLLHGLATKAAGGCLLQLENAQLTPLSVVGAGGKGTYTMAFVDSVLNIQMGDLLAEQYSRSRGITLSASDLAAAKSDLQSTLDGEISAEVQQASTSLTGRMVHRSRAW